MDEQKSEKLKRIRTLKKMLDAPKFVEDASDVVPFAWAHPPVALTDRRMSKTYRSLLENSGKPPESNR